MVSQLPLSCLWEDNSWVLKGVRVPKCGLVEPRRAHPLQYEKPKSNPVPILFLGMRDVVQGAHSVQSPPVLATRRSGGFGSEWARRAHTTHPDIQQTENRSIHQ